MAKRRIKRRKPLSRKQTGHSEHAPLAALAPVISPEADIFGDSQPCGDCAKETGLPSE